MKNKELNIKHITVILIFISYFFSYAQKSYKIQTIAFYNLENLFDTINNPNKLDELSPIMEIKSKRAVIYKDKLFKISNVLCEIGKERNNLPPSLIGVAEIENRSVLEDLISTPPLSNYNYGIIHYESPDLRGIDTALLYNKDVYKPTYNKAISTNLYKEGQKIHTRDILWSTGYFMDEKIHLFINHWPSRRGGTKKSSILRKRVANTLKKHIDKVYLENNDAKIIIMGDFNDSPTDKSIKTVLGTKFYKNALKKQELYNPYGKMFLNGFNTLVYRGNLYLFDQIIFSKSFISETKEYSSFLFYKAGVYNPYHMTLQSGKYKGSPKRSFSGGKYLGGYSDHYPVYSYLLKENK